MFLPSLFFYPKPLRHNHKYVDDGCSKSAEMSTKLPDYPQNQIEIDKKLNVHFTHYPNCLIFASNFINKAFRHLFR